MIRPTTPADTPTLVAIAHGTGVFKPHEMVALQEVLEEALGMLRDDVLLTQNDDQPERPEAERGPGRSAVALAPPLIDRGKRKRHVSQQADVAQNLDRKFQEPPPGPLGARQTVRGEDTNCTYGAGFLRICRTSGAAILRLMVARLGGWNMRKEIDGQDRRQDQLQPLRPR